MRLPCFRRLAVFHLLADVFPLLSGRASTSRWTCFHLDVDDDISAETDRVCLGNYPGCLGDELSRVRCMQLQNTLL